MRHRARLRRWNPDAAWGRRAEDLAHRHLQRAGMRVVARNWTRPGLRGEVDLVAWDGDRLVFVEVKSRRDSLHGPPERAIDPLKKLLVGSAAFYFLRRWRVPPDRARCDLVTVVFHPFQIRHIPDAWSLRES
ncbi:MAG: YraN family protein [Candidatus Solibacter usitatus]|nr:YraN family protein [Candidatus Solibacter usitatus]